MPIFIFSTFHEIGKNLIEITGRVGFTFEIRDELDYKCIYCVSKMGYDIQDNAHVVVSPSNQNASEALPLNDSHEYYRHFSRSRDKLSYVRIKTGSSGKNCFSGIIGFTDYFTQSPQNLIGGIPTDDGASNKFHILQQMADRYPSWSTDIDDRSK